MIVGLVTSTGRHSLPRCVASLSDCDQVIVVEDRQRRGQAWARNELLRQAPPGSIVRFADDDDVAFSTRTMAERLEVSGADILAASFISGSTREIVPTDPLAAAIDSVGPWSWVARADAIRDVAWDATKTRATGTWYWLQMMDAGLRFAFAPDIWGYHWAPSANGVTAGGNPPLDLFDELARRVAEAGRNDLLLPLLVRVRRACGVLPPEQERLVSIAVRFRDTFGQYPRLTNPVTFSEKVAARKAHEAHPLFSVWCDKLAARAWARRRLGEDLAPPLLVAATEIPETLPTRYFAKANHGSGWFFPFEAGVHDEETARATMAEWLRSDYGLDRGEEEYADVRKAILLEELLPGPVRDVRLFCFGGRAEVAAIDVDWRQPTHRRDFYGRTGEHLAVTQIGPNDPASTRTSKLPDAIEIADELSAGIDFVRVDLIEADGRLYFMEMSPFPSGGNSPFSPGFDEWLGQFWTVKPWRHTAAAA